MNSFNDQDSMDFFLPDLTTHPTPIADETCIQTAERKLATGSRFVYSVGCSEFSTYDKMGEEADEIIYPHEVILVPTDTMRERSADWLENERTEGSWGAQYFEEMCPELLSYPLSVDEDGNEDNTVWWVYVVPEPDADRELVGRVDITDSF